MQNRMNAITELLLAVKAKKRHHTGFWSRRPIVRLSWAVLIILIICAIGGVAIGIGLQQYDDSRNPYVNIRNEVLQYYMADDYLSEPSQDAEAQLAKTNTQSYSFIVFVFPLDIELDSRDNPQSATVTFSVSSIIGESPTWRHNLSASLSIKDGGRHWQIVSIDRA